MCGLFKKVFLKFVLVVSQSSHMFLQIKNSDFARIYMEMSWRLWSDGATLERWACFIPRKNAIIKNILKILALKFSIFCKGNNKQL